jgi:hypothetical protein
MTQEKVLAEIIETANSKIKAARIVVQASSSDIFKIISNPKRHNDIDGSATVTANVSGPEVLVLGSRFGMKLRLGIT